MSENWPRWLIMPIMLNNHFEKMKYEGATMNSLTIVGRATWDQSKNYGWSMPINKFLPADRNGENFVRNVCSDLLKQVNKRDGVSEMEFRVLFSHVELRENGDYSCVFEFSLGL